MNIGKWKQDRARLLKQLNEHTEAGGEPEGFVFIDDLRKVELALQGWAALGLYEAVQEEIGEGRGDDLPSSILSGYEELLQMRQDLGLESLELEDEGDDE